MALCVFIFKTLHLESATPKITNPPAVLIAIKDHSSWMVEDITNRVRIAFKFDNGKWSAMPNYFNTEEPQNGTLSDLINSAYPKEITFPNKKRIKKIVSNKYADCGAYELAPDYQLDYILSTATSSVYSKTLFLKTLANEEEKQKIAPLLKTRVSFYTVRGNDKKPIRKTEIDIEDFDFEVVRVKNYNRSELICVKIKPDLFDEDDYNILDAYTIDSDDNRDPIGGYVSHWFAMIDGNPKYIGSGLEFFGCFDLANTNTLQFVFKTSGYNRDGYRLFYNDFKNHVNFMWNYN
jgi:hypothetical protein